MSKITLTTVGSISQNPTSAATEINANNAIIQAAFDNTLSRNGTSPNQMSAPLDMNSNRIINLPAGIGNTEPVTIGAFNAAVIGKGNVPVGGTANQVLAKNSSTDYDIHWISEASDLSAGSNIIITGTSPATIATTLTPTFTTVNTATIPTVVDTLVGRATTDTLTNKTLTSPVLVTPALGTPVSGTLSNCTGLPIAGTTGYGTGVAAALAANVTGSGGISLTTSPVFVTPVLGTPTSGTLTNCTGLPNAGLVNSSVTVGTTAIALGASSTTLAGLTSIFSTNHSASGALTFQSNGSTFAGQITTGQQWQLGLSAITPLTGPFLTITRNTVTPPALGTPTGISGTGQNLLNLVGADASSADISMQAFGSNGSIRYFTARGTAASPTTITSGTTVGSNFAYGYNGSAYLAAAGFVFSATDTFTTGPLSGTRVDIYATPTGTSGISIGASIGAGFMVGDQTDPGAGAITATGLIKSKSATAGIGYATGAGGTVAQITSRTTGVTLNKVSGSITLFSQVNTAISGATAQTFTLTNSAIAATDTVHVTQQTGTDKYLVFVTNTVAGSCQITNYTTGGTTNEAPVFNFTVIKGVTS